MLGREGLGERERRLERRRVDHDAPTAAASAPARSAHARRAAPGRRAATRDDRALAVLGLGEQVERDERAGRRPPSATTKHVARPEEAVDPDVAADLPLGLLHVEAAGPGDDVDARRSISVP